MDDVRLKLQRHLIEELGPVLSDRRVDEDDLRAQVDALLQEVHRPSTALVVWKPQRRRS
jgi:uncharacterized coiled-coil protein SlyX